MLDAGADLLMGLVVGLLPAEQVGGSAAIAQDRCRQKSD